MKKGCLIAVLASGVFLTFLWIVIVVGLVAGAARRSRRPRRYQRHPRHQVPLREPPAEATTQPMTAGPKFPVVPDLSDGALSPANAPVPIDASPMATTANGDGALIWEAEWPNRVTGSFECIGSHGASGDAALHIRDGRGRNVVDHYHPAHTPFVDMGVADYWITVPTAGKYRLFMRVWCPDQCSNSCFVSVGANSELAYFPGGISGIFGAHRWRWPDTMYRKWLWLENDGTTYRLDAGPTRIRLEAREDGIGVDQIALVPVGAPPPVGPMPCSATPGVTPWPDQARFSTTRPSTRRSQTLTPIEMTLSPASAALPLGGAPVTSAWVWLRSNAGTAHTASLTLNCPYADIAPGHALTIAFSPEKPWALIPLTIAFPEDAPYHDVDLSAGLRGRDWPELEVRRTRRIGRPLTWWLLGPIPMRDERGLGARMAADDELDVSASVRIGMRTYTWRRAEAPKHYSDFGALDFEKVYMMQSHCVAIAAARIAVTAPGQYVAFCSADDEMDLYCGGRRILTERTSGPLTDGLARYRVNLPAGEHWLVACVRQYERRWRLLLQFQKEDGTPAQSVLGIADY